MHHQEPVRTPLNPNDSNIPQGQIPKHSTLSHLLAGRLPGARAFLNHMADPSEFIDNDAFTALLLITCLLDPLPGLAHFSHKCTLMVGSNPCLSPMNGLHAVTPCRDLAAWHMAKHGKLQAAFIRAFLTLQSVVYAHRETMLPCQPGLSNQAVGAQHMHQHCRSDIALQVQQTETEGGPPAAIQNAQGDSLQHLDIVTACAGSKTACNANIDTRFPHNARAVDPSAFLTTLMTAKIRHYRTWHGVECQPLAFEMTGGRHIDTDKYLNSLFRKSAKIGDPYAMRRLYALRRECSFICARIVGQQTATAPSNFKNNPRRPFTISPAFNHRRA